MVIPADRHNQDVALAAQNQGISRRIFRAQVQRRAVLSLMPVTRQAVIRADRYRSDATLMAAQNHRVSGQVLCTQVPETCRTVRAASDKQRLSVLITTALIGPAAISNGQPPVRASASLKTVQPPLLLHR